MIQAFPLPTAMSEPSGITAGPDGNLWFTEEGTGVGSAGIGTINPTTHAIAEFSTPTAGSDPVGIAAGPDGNLWFTEGEVDQIGAINPTTHAIAEFPIPGGGTRPALLFPSGITAGPDGNLWFTEAFGDKIGMINPTTHAIAQFAIPTAGSRPTAIAAGPDGNLWFTEDGANQIGMINPTTHAISEFPIPVSGSAVVDFPSGIAAGPDGDLWFTESVGPLPGADFPSEIGRINPTTHVITMFPLPTVGTYLGGITAGPGGSLWFTVAANGPDTTSAIGQINPTSGVITEYPIPTSPSVPEQIAAGPDGNLWFADSLGNSIGQVDVNAPPSDGPTVVSVRRFGFHEWPTRIVLTFNEPLAPGPAQYLTNYRLTGLEAGDRPIRIRSAVYNPVAQTVTLHPFRRLYLFARYRLTVNGTTPNGVIDSAGRLLDGQRTGQPGSDFSTVVSIKDLVQPRHDPEHEPAEVRGGDGRASRK